MRKLFVSIVVLFLSIIVLAGCGTNEKKEETTNNQQQSQNKEDSAFPVTIKDGLDNEVVIESKPEKIVSMIPSNTEIVYSLGMGEQLVGVSDLDNYPKEVTEKEKIGGVELNIEKIISLSPDLVLAHASTAQTVETGLQQLKDAGITVLVVNDAQSFEQVYKSITMIGTSLGEAKKAEELVATMKKDIANIKEKAQEINEEDRKSVYVEVDASSDIYGVGANTFMNEMLGVIGAKNALTEQGWIKIDQEAIIERNPDVIITTYGKYTDGAVDQVLNRNGWQDITAVKNKQVSDVDPDLVTRSGPRLVEGVEELAKAVYPEVFK